MRRSLSWLAACVLLAGPAAAQTPAADAEEERLSIEQVVQDLVALAARNAETGLNQPFSRTVDPSAAGSIVNFLAGQLVDREAYNTLADLMLVRADTQVGSTPDSTGTSSLTMKGLVPAILGFGVEHGAITRDVNGTVATFRVSPAGLVKALQGKAILDIYHDYSVDPAFRFASRFSAAASFDTSRGDSPNTLLANEQQLSAWSVNVILVNHRDPRAKGYATHWRAAGLTKVPAYVASRAALDDALKGWPEFTRWQTALVDRVKREVDVPFAANGDRSAAVSRFQAILEEALAGIRILDVPDAQVSVAMAAYVQQLTGVVEARNNIYAYANEGALVTFDWTTMRDEHLPDLFTLTGVYENSFTASRKDDFTANLALRFYHDAPEGTDRTFKDFSLSAQWDRPLGSLLNIPFIVSAATRYQFIPQDIPVPASGLIAPVTADSVDASPVTSSGAAGVSAIAPKGHLIVGQAKLTVPIRNGVRIPLSFTVANRTELIEEKTVRANFGVTFDLDAFAAAVRAR